MKQNIQSLRREIIEAGKRMYARGYVASNDGNISARIDDKHILITPTGISKGFMDTEDLIIVDLEGNLLSGTKKQNIQSLQQQISRIQLPETGRGRLLIYSKFRRIFLLK